MDWPAAGEESKDLVAIPGEDEWGCDNSQGPGEAQAVDCGQGQKRSILSPPCLCAGHPRVRALPPC